jgi:hypothetical protein
LLINNGFMRQEWHMGNISFQIDVYIPRNLHLRCNDRCQKI